MYTPGTTFQKDAFNRRVLCTGTRIQGGAHILPLGLSAAELMATVAKTNRAHAPTLNGGTTVKAAA